ncbi:MAG: hypothetical protein LBH14_08445, partial [Desulfobulbaceae bacterium]|nr:hypothetical protein [Desulfobulbaceae bacterium]
MRSTGIVVLGMHRSGTSACTGLLRLYGAYLGEVIDSHPQNPKGYWENKNAMSLNEEILRLLQCRWDWPWVFPEGWLNQIPDELCRRRDDVVTELCAQPLWAIKDPRMCLLWPWWQAGFIQTNSHIKVLLCLRHPMQVAKSLAKRDQIDTGHALLMWAQHVLLAEQHSRGMRRTVVFYDDILSSQTSAIIDIQNKLDITFPVAPRQDLLDDFISAELRHHYDNEYPDSAIGRLCQKIFTVCHEEDALNQPEKWDAFGTRFALLLQEDRGDRLLWALAEVLHLNEEVLRLNTSLSQQNDSLMQAAEQISHRDREINRIQAEAAEQISHRDREINRIQAEAAE